MFNTFSGSFKFGHRPVRVVAGSAPSPGTSGAYNDLIWTSSQTWSDRGTNGADGLVTGSGATSGTDSYGPYTNLTSTSYINNGINLSSPFTISIIASLNPSTYWASLFGCDNFGTQGGWWAYLTSSTSLFFGSTASSGVTATVSNINSINMWTFIWDGTNATIYQNKNSLATASISNPSGAHPNNTNWGARHTNAGANQIATNQPQDPCPGTYRRLLRWNTALSNGGVTSNYNSFKSYYNLP